MKPPFLSRILLYCYLVISLTSCDKWRDIRDGHQIDTKTNYISDGYFNEWPYGNIFVFNSGQNDADVAINDHWLTFGDGNGVRPAHTISRAYGPTSLKFEVFDVGSNLDTSLRVYQKIPNWRELVDKDVMVSVKIKTKLKNHVQFVIDSGDTHLYSPYAQGTGEWETLTVRYHVPTGAILLWLKIGMTTADITAGEFLITDARVELAN